MNGRGYRQRVRPDIERQISGAVERPRVVLLVDDNHVVTELFSHAVRTLYDGERMAVHVAGGALEAVSLCERERVDLAIIDYFLPGGSGAALVRRLRALPRYKTLPIIATSRPAELAASEMLAAGANRYLQKPVLHSTLHEALMALLPARQNLESGCGF